MTEEEFNKICKRYAIIKLPEIIIQDGIRSIKQHIQDQGEICIVSSGFTKYVETYFKQLNVKVIGSSINCDNEHPMMQLNCNYEEKFNAVKSVYNLQEYERVIVYGRSPESDGLMSIATDRFYDPYEPEYPD